uniref:Uncharacterized protein n=1 Tax=Arundo donax TaxID=35708 RepID=A0A0A8ZRZ9_ARUDO
MLMILGWKIHLLIYRKSNQFDMCYVPSQ